MSGRRQCQENMLMFHNVASDISRVVGVGAIIWAALTLIVGRYRYKRLRSQPGVDKKYYLRRLLGHEIGAASIASMSFASLGISNRDISFGLAAALLSL